MSLNDFGNVPLMWEPTEDSGKLMKQFMKHISEKYGVKINDYWDLHRWSTENFRDFWAEMWDMSGIIHSEKYEEVFPEGGKMEDVSLWFRGAKLNYAENMLRYRDDHVAIITAGEESDVEKITYAELYREACRYGAAFRKMGLQKGDRAVCFCSNRKEPVFAMIGATSIGAIWSAALPLVGADAALNCLRQISPKFLLTVDRFRYNSKEFEMLEKVKRLTEELPSLEKVVIIPSKPDSRKKDISWIRNSCFLDEFLTSGLNEDGSVPELEFEQLPFDHPLFINYTSGTTGTPKALVHGVAMILPLSRDFYLHSDGSRDDVWLTITPAGWSIWNMFCSVLSLGVTLVLFEGVPYFHSPTYFWDMVEEFKISRLYFIPRFLHELEKKGYLPSWDFSYKETTTYRGRQQSLLVIISAAKHRLTFLKSIMAGACYVKPQIYEFVYKRLKPNVTFGSGYGSTEMLGMSMMLEKTVPIYKGEISCPSLGIEASCYNDKGEPVLGELGELVFRAPTPNLPLYLWGDKDKTKYRETYYSKYPDVFTPGDMCIVNPVTKGFIICGRSDDTLKPKGKRFGSSEIYNIVDTFPEVQDSICVSQYSKCKDERVVLFLKMQNGHEFTEDLVHRIQSTIERELSMYPVPEVVVQTEDVPYNMNGKKMESIVKKIINNMPYNPETVRNKECLKNFENVPELQGF